MQIGNISLSSTNWIVDDEEDARKLCPPPTKIVKAILRFTFDQAYQEKCVKNLADNIRAFVTRVTDTAIDVLKLECNASSAASQQYSTTTRHGGPAAASSTSEAQAARLKRLIEKNHEGHMRRQHLSRLLATVRRCGAPLFLLPPPQHYSQPGPPPHCCHRLSYSRPFDSAARSSQIAFSAAVGAGPSC